MMHDTETGQWPAATVHSDNQSATHAHIDQSVNKALPWCVMAAAASFLSLGIVISDHARFGDLIRNAENRALDAQQETLITSQKCQSLEIEMARHGVVPPPVVSK